MRGWECDYPLFTTVNRIVHSHFPPTDIVNYLEVGFKGFRGWCQGLLGVAVGRDEGSGGVGSEGLGDVQGFKQGLFDEVFSGGAVRGGLKHEGKEAGRVAQTCRLILSHFIGLIAWAHCVVLPCHHSHLPFTQSTQHRLRVAPYRVRRAPCRQRRMCWPAAAV